MSEFAFVFGLNYTAKLQNSEVDTEINMIGKDYQDAVKKILSANIPFIEGEESLYLKEFYEVVVIVKEGE